MLLIQLLVNYLYNLVMTKKFIVFHMLQYNLYLNLVLKKKKV